MLQAIMMIDGRFASLVVINKEKNSTCSRGGHDDNNNDPNPPAHAHNNKPSSSRRCHCTDDLNEHGWIPQRTDARDGCGGVVLARSSRRRAPPPPAPWCVADDVTDEGHWLPHPTTRERRVQLHIEERGARPQRQQRPTPLPRKPRRRRRATDAGAAVVVCAWLLLPLHRNKAAHSF